MSLQAKIEKKGALHFHHTQKVIESCLSILNIKIILGNSLGQK